MKLHLIYYLMQLLKGQWRTRSEIEEIQQRKLRVILRHAYDKVDYYRERFDAAGIRPETIRDSRDLCKIPMTTKREIQALPLEKLTDRGVRRDRCMKMKTTGSTGTPLEVVIGEKDRRYRGAVYLRALFSNGYKLRDKTVRIMNVLHQSPHHWYQSLGIRREVGIERLDPMEEQIRKLRQERPDVLGGLPTDLPRIAEALLERGIEDVRPRMIVTGGEVMTAAIRKAIEETFGVRPVDLYSTWEFGNIAWECQRYEGYHLNADGLVVEVVRDGRPVPVGEPGEILITGLQGFAMPFIRYRIGDIGVLSGRTCSCGRGLPLLERIEGRSNDLIRLRDGRILSPFAVIIVLIFTPGVARFRFVQEERDQFSLYLVKGRDFSPASLKRIDEKLRDTLGSDISLKIDVVEEIPSDPSGKIRAVVSNVRAGDNE